jgi:hypothetical protein
MLNDLQHIRCDLNVRDLVEMLLGVVDFIGVAEHSGDQSLLPRLNHHDVLTLRQHDAHFSVSSVMNLSKSVGKPGVGVAPNLSIRTFISGSAFTSVSTALKRPIVTCLRNGRAFLRKDSTTSNVDMCHPTPPGRIVSAVVAISNGSLSYPQSVVAEHH